MHIVNCFCYTPYDLYLTMYAIYCITKFARYMIYDIYLINTCNVFLI